MPLLKVMVNMLKAHEHVGNEVHSRHPPEPEGRPYIAPQTETPDLGWGAHGRD